MKTMVLYLQLQISTTCCTVFEGNTEIKKIDSRLFPNKINDNRLYLCLFLSTIIILMTNDKMTCNEVKTVIHIRSILRAI